jgi:uncharacterized membrane protein HdeD (DUF308 family)
MLDGTTPGALNINQVTTIVICVILIVSLGLVVFYFTIRNSRERVRYIIVLQLQALIITAFVSFLAAMSGVRRVSTTLRHWPDEFSVAPDLSPASRPVSWAG